MNVALSNPTPGFSAHPGTGRRVLVTGGSGRIGRHLMDELVCRGYSVCALTSKLPFPETHTLPRVEWKHHDWQHSLDFEQYVEGCDAVLHLGAEIWDIPKMFRSNVEVTQSLARAAERCGVKFFGYTSSIAVYGSPLDRIVTEKSPTLTAHSDIKKEYLANCSLRTYGRTKLLGEITLSEECRRTEYVIFRPTVVVDVPNLTTLGDWSSIRKFISGRRFTHHIYVKDVAIALIMFMETSLNREQPVPGVTTYNLSDDDTEDSSYASVFRLVFAKTNDKRFRVSIDAPLFCYALLNCAKQRLFTLRHSLGTMTFSPRKLYATGYRHKFGMNEAHNLLIKELLRNTSIG